MNIDPTPSAHIRRIVTVALSELGMGQRRLEAARGLPRWSLRGIMDPTREQSPSIDRAAEICRALGYELVIRPRATDLKSVIPPPRSQIPASGAGLGPVSDPRLATLLAVLADRWEEADAATRRDLEVRLWHAFPDLKEREQAGSGRRLVRLAEAERAGRGEGVEDADALAHPEVTARPVDLPHSRHVEVRKLAAAAGGGAAVLSEDVTGYLAFHRGWLDRHALDPAQCTVIDVAGDSMEPALPDGCSILVDRGRRRRLSGHLFVLLTGDGVVVKRLARGDGDDWRLVSDNDSPSWPDIPWSDDTEIIGEVKWMARTF